MINIKAVDDAIEWAARDRHERTREDPAWLQGEWLVETDCGTACCVAGRIVLAAGYRPIGRGWTRVVRGDDEGSVSDVATRIILGEHEREDTDLMVAIELLFSGGNRLSDLRDARDELVDVARRLDITLNAE